MPAGGPTGISAITGQGAVTDPVDITPPEPFGGTGDGAGAHVREPRPEHCHPFPPAWRARV